MANIIKTLQGKSLDIEALMLQNENVRAVGNMNTDATGKSIKNETVASNTIRPNKALRKNYSKKVQDAPVMNSKKAAIDLVRQYILSEKNNPNDDLGIKEIATKIDASAKSSTNSKSSTRTGTTRKTKDGKKLPGSKIPREDLHKDDEVSDELLQAVLNRPNIGGLSGAIAKAQAVNQERRKTPREEQRNVRGVKRI